MAGNKKRLYVAVHISQRHGPGWVRSTSRVIWLAAGRVHDIFGCHNIKLLSLVTIGHLSWGPRSKMAQSVGNDIWISRQKPDGRRVGLASNRLADRRPRNRSATGPSRNCKDR